MNLQASMISMSLNHSKMILAEKDWPGQLHNHGHGKTEALPLSQVIGLEENRQHEAELQKLRGGG